MHDIESCRAIFDIVDRESRERNGKRVVRLKLSVGLFPAQTRNILEIP